MAELESASIPKTFGAILLGGLCASLLSGSVFIQALVYFKTYPSDSPRLRVLVSVVWFLDTMHTICIWISMWNYFIDSYGDIPAFDHISWSLGLCIIFPAMLIFSVHLFFARRIFMLSKHNYYLTVPIVILAFNRLVAGFVASSFMLHLQQFSVFREKIGWIVTAGLGLSSATDVLITTSLCILLHNSRTGAATVDVIIDALIRYAFETASLTTAGTIVSMLCWITLRNMIFLGLHFLIAKLYANSLLVTLNTRETVRQARSQGSGEYGLRVDMPSLRRPDNLTDLKFTSPTVTTTTFQPTLTGTTTTFQPTLTTSSSFPEEKQVKVTIERSVQSDVA